MKTYETIITYKNGGKDSAFCASLEAALQSVANMQAVLDRDEITAVSIERIKLPKR
jgi:hypothetical protein